MNMLTELRRMQAQLVREMEGSRDFAGVYPAINLYDNGEAFLIRAEVPGMDKTKLEVMTKGNRVSIRGERTDGVTPAEAALHRRERGRGVFHRVVDLPEQVNSDKTTAEYKNGVLSIVCPRAESAKARRVQIA